MGVISLAIKDDWLVVRQTARDDIGCIEQHYRFIKKITEPMKGFKTGHSVVATKQDIKAVQMIRKK